MTTLYIRQAARADGEGAPARFALVADNGAIERHGEGALRSLGQEVAASRRVVLLLAAADVTLLHVKVPPLSAARLKAALPGLVEEQVLGDPAECVLVAAPQQAPDGQRTIAVVQRSWLEPQVQTVLALGARAVAALPSQLCLPIEPGSVAAAVEPGAVILRLGQYNGLGLAVESAPPAALATVRALAGDAPLTLYVEADRLGEYQALAADGGAPVKLEADDWKHWIAGARTSPLDLVPGLGAAGAKARDWSRWRWPLRLALAALVVNLVGLNIEWRRLKAEADTIRLTMLQTFKAAYPKETAILDPALQMRRNIALAKANSGQVGPDEFTYLAAAFGEAVRGLGRPPAVTALEYRERTLTVKLKPDSVDPGAAGQIKAALGARNLGLSEAAPATWLVRSTGAKP